MALLDKISQLAKTASEKTGVAMELAKISSKISAEKAKINNFKLQISDIVIALYDSGTAFDEEITKLITEIRYCNQAIADLDAESARIRGNKTKEESSGATCPACNAAIPDDADFCPKCGTQV